MYKFSIIADKKFWKKVYLFNRELLIEKKYKLEFLLNITTDWYVEKRVTLTDIL